MPEPLNPQSSALPGTEAAEELVVNLQIISPSAGVNRPLTFPDLPAVTTMKQLKERIRQALPLRPSDESQRLIHRGRALLRESDSLLDIFGADALRVPERQTIHLVIREPTDSHSSSPAPTTARGPSPAPNAVAQQTAQIPFGAQSLSGLTRRTHSQPAAPGGANARIPSPAPVQAPQQAEHVGALHHQHQNMSQWLTQIQREAMARAIVHQNQRGRAHMGMRGLGDPTAGQNHVVGYPVDPNGGRSSPAPSHTIYRETIGPNGHTYHVETVVRSTTPGQQNGLTPADVQSILRGADANQATAAMTSAMQRSASGASLHGRFLNQPGVTTPVPSTGAVMSASGRATPDLGPRTSGGATNLPATAGNQPNAARLGLDVYLLSSPEGPRALLFNGATAETYYSPRMRLQSNVPQFGNMMSFPNLAHPSLQPQATQTAQHPQDQPANHTEMANNQPPAPAGQQPGLHPANPPAAGLPPLLLQMWPHIWLIFRLALFVWLFTSPNASWSNWFTVISLAVLVFLLSTGMLDGVAANAWRPIGRHLENLLPTPDEHIRRRRQLAAGTGAPGEQQPLAQVGDADPSQMAARLVAEHGQRNWVTTQIRRVERAGLLFLASIAPGVAERHIANLEAETQAEEAQRRQAEAAAAATAESAQSDAAQGAETQPNSEHNAGNQPAEGEPVNERLDEVQDNAGAQENREELLAL